MDIIDPIPQRLWDEIADHCDYATFFHTRAWAKIIERTFPEDCRIETKAFRFGPEDWVLFPMMLHGEECKGFFKTYYSNVPGVYGGLISKNPLTPQKIEKILFSLKKMRTKSIEVFGNPYTDMDSFFPGWKKKDNFTHVIRLDEFSDEEGLFNSYDNEVRRVIRRAMKSGLTIEMARTLEDVRDYFTLYQAALARWGKEATSHYAFDFFRNIFQDESGKAVFWLARLDGKVIGGSVKFYHNRVCSSWQSAYLQEGLKIGVAKCLAHHAILDAKRRGLTYYDLNPSGGHEGTARFKESLGAVKKCFSEYYWEENPLYKIFAQTKRLIRRPAPVEKKPEMPRPPVRRQEVAVQP